MSEPDEEPSFEQAVSAIYGPDVRIVLDSPPMPAWREIKGGGVWPLPDEGMDGLEWRLRYQSRPISDSDLMAAASVVAAYRALVRAPRVRRDHVVRELRALKPSAQSVKVGDGQ
jgi:hypothetical protein